MRLLLLIIWFRPAQALEIFKWLLYNERLPYSYVCVCVCVYLYISIYIYKCVTIVKLNQKVY